MGRLCLTHNFSPVYARTCKTQISTIVITLRIAFVCLLIDLDLVDSFHSIAKFLCFH